MMERPLDEHDPEHDKKGEADATEVAEARGTYVSLLFTRYRGALHRYLSHLVATEEVSDLVQETYFRLLRHEQIVQIEALARGLLFQTATNLARDLRRRRKSRQAALHERLDEDHELGSSGTPDEHLASEQTLAIIEQTLARLPTETRAVFVLSRFNEMSYPEIAQALRLSPRTVARRMAEALEAFSRAMRSMR